MTEEKKTAKDWTKIILKRSAFLLIPIAAYILILPLTWLMYPPENGLFTLPPSLQWTVYAALLFAYLVPPFGKETIIPAMLFGDNIQMILSDILHLGLDTTEITGYPIWLIFVGIVGMDIAVSAFITLNFDLLLKIPLVGAWLRWIMRSAQAVLKKKQWIENLSSAGLLIFMYIPLQGSGAMTTSVIARLLGYKPLHAIGLVTLGSILSCTTVIFGFSSIVALWQINPVLAVLFGLLIAAVIIVIALFWNKIIKRFIKTEPEEL
ncbi:MAG: small multi-drug export protein [Methanocorpusculum sp.]|nr:small multi-drug export protein [Methanocorpusculum sp.]